MRWPIFIANTPFTPVPTATLYEDTWMGHILPNHPEVRHALEAVKATVEAPELVCSATSAGYYTFVSSSHLDAGGKPLIVVVTGQNVPSGDPLVVASTFFGNKAYLDQKQTKWQVHYRKT
jgi:hypothetical protein